MTEITQADRDAAKSYDPFLWEMKPRSREFQSLVQAFARHRMEERAAIVAWLREGVRGEWFPGLANAIEAGEHLK